MKVGGKGGVYISPCRIFLAWNLEGQLHQYLKEKIYVVLENFAILRVQILLTMLVPCLLQYCSSRQHLHMYYVLYNKVLFFVGKFQYKQHAFLYEDRWAVMGLNSR